MSRETFWRVTNRETREVKYALSYDNITACESVGWKFSYCDCDVVASRKADDKYGLN